MRRDVGALLAGPRGAYIGGMTRLLLALLLLAPPVLAQDSASAASAAQEADGLEMPEAEVAPEDPVAAWEADHTAILPAEGIDLQAFEYVARPLVIFADSPRQPQLIEQVRLLEEALRDLALRDVVVIVDSDPEARSAVRRELRPRGFGVVLLDKDGRVAMRQPAPTAVREIARAIDRTPIRQEELREQRGAGTR